ncbi:hypothetical protein NDU88_005269 [Pleurodeles waltl]|uniref:Uncharacterized protein n=1 Tax=Pleurodeles waltl TaxID=8319 RepID=A0AAV7L093_PLEWA|nr:hypothetical protein NDU88_005269 [Pleurodeles waltl]
MCLPACGLCRRAQGWHRWLVPVLSDPRVGAAAERGREQCFQSVVRVYIVPPSLRLGTAQEPQGGTASARYCLCDSAPRRSATKLRTWRIKSSGFARVRSLHSGREISDLANAFCYDLRECTRSHTRCAESENVQESGGAVLCRAGPREGDGDTGGRGRPGVSDRCPRAHIWFR